ncbi:asparaginase [Mariniluteicoccus flavus]
MSARVLVIYTGGTLGMRPTDHGWEPGADLEGWLAGLAAAELPGITVDLLTLEPLIDSSNATPHDWQRIVDAVRDGAEAHDGIVVLHGTDTMAFAAAALHHALGPVPVVLTGAQRSLVLEDSDAGDNVLGAVRRALDPALDRVVVFFDGEVIDGERATKVSSTADHAFGSVNGCDRSLISDDLEVSRGTEMPDRERSVALKRDRESRSPSERRRDEEPRPFADVDLVVLTLHPGLRAERLAAQLTPPPQAAIVRAYGSGNAPDNDPALLAALAEASAAGTVVVVTTQCGHGGVELGQYAVSQGLLATGAVSGGDLGVEALVALLTFLLSQGLGPGEVRGQLAERVLSSAARG